MSELKVYHCNEWHNEYTEFYLKFEADKVIAELEKEKEYVIEQTAKVINGQEKELRRQKHKRCLANAEACMHKRWRTDEGFDYARSHRHMNKWLALAEEFKEAK